MKKILLISFVLLLGLSSCTVPTATDFESHARPLATDELIAIWRFPRHASASPPEVLDTTYLHAQAMESVTTPLFQQVIPKIFADIKAGKLVIREGNDIANIDEPPIADLEAKMRERYETDWQELDPFLLVFHITQRRNVAKKGFLADELELQLIWKDPDGMLPESILGSVRMPDLLELGYTIEKGDNSYEFRQYLKQVVPYAYPIHYKNLDMANGLRTLEQAFFTKDIVLDGKWNELEWLGGEPNLSNMKKLVVPESELQTYTGMYSFEPNQGSELTIADGLIEVEISVEEDHLLASWPNQGPYHLYQIFAGGEGKFFTVHGDIIQFEEQSDGSLQWIIQGADKTNSVGVREK